MIERSTGIAGILFVVLFVVASLQAGPGNPNVAADKIAHDLVVYRSSVILTSYLVLVAAIPLVFFAAGIGKRLSTAGPFSSLLSTTSLVSSAISAALLAAASAVLGTLGGYVANGSGPDTLRGMYAVYDGVFTAGGLFLGVFVVTTSLLAFSAQRIPAPLRWAGVLVGGLLMIGAGSLAFPFKGVGPLWVIGQLGSVLWIAASSVWLLLQPSPTATAAPGDER